MDDFFEVPGGVADADIQQQPFWDELCAVVESPCATHEAIDDALRSWLDLVSTCRDQYIQCEEDLAICSQKLLESPIFCENRDYVRTQIVYSLLQEDEAAPLHVIANFLLLDGRSDETVFRRMIDEGCFARLVELVNGRREVDRRLHRLLLELMYEMSRVERLRNEDLLQVDDGLVTYLFQLTESLSDDVDDPYHYHIIRVLLVLNEQYMVAETTAAVNPTSPSSPLTNKIIKILGLRGRDFRTFGENIILLLNRETETSLQLLILKLLYLLFTTKSTYEYFYTNDLRVLLDVIIRNLLDLPNESMSLRHTYLRVLYPLLSHTQLSQPPHYKRDEILRVLYILGGSGNVHFAPADETTLRLVDRVSRVKWLAEDPGEGEVARKFLGISLSPSQSASSVSVVDVAAVTEKPGVKTPSRKADLVPGERKGSIAAVTEAHGENGTNGEAGAGASGEDSTASERSSSSPESKTKENGEGRPATVVPHLTRSKRTLPAVPKHRHGNPTRPHSSSTTNVHVINGHVHQPKKLPPKAPPPRRGARLRATASSTNLQTAVGSSPVS